MNEPRELLDAYAAKEVHVVRTVSARAVAPKLIAALDAVLAWCDAEDARLVEWSEKHNPDCECERAEAVWETTGAVREAIKNALESP